LISHHEITPALNLSLNYAITHYDIYLTLPSIRTLILSIVYSKNDKENKELNITAIVDILLRIDTNDDTYIGL
jgi:hypothetical protein